MTGHDKPKPWSKRSVGYSPDPQRIGSTMPPPDGMLAVRLSVTELDLIVGRFEKLFTRMHRIGVPHEQHAKDLARLLAALRSKT